MKEDEESLLQWDKTVHFGSADPRLALCSCCLLGAGLSSITVSITAYITKGMHVLDVCAYKMGLLVFSPSKQVTLGIVPLPCTCHSGLIAHSSWTPFRLT